MTAMQSTIPAADRPAASSRPVALPWTAQELDLDRIEGDRVREDDELFLLVCSASFIESGSDLYTRNLVERFADDAEVAGWLREQWEPEELRHGRALRAYVEHVWPEFDWESAYADFLADYSKLCTVEDLEPRQGQELAARCVVEMGTTTYYTALHETCDEPVLKALFWRIRCDEVSHYKHFLTFFQKYREIERLHRGHVAMALVRRALELRRDDATVALRHAVAWQARADAARGRPPRAESSEARGLRAIKRVSAHIPMDLAVKMTIKPLLLKPRIERAVMRPLAALGRGVLLE